MEAHAGNDERGRPEASCTAKFARTAPTCGAFNGANSAGAAQLNRIFRGLIILIALAVISAVCFMCLASAQEPPKSSAATFQISGSVRNGKTFLPGVAVTAANTRAREKYSVVCAHQRGI